MVELSIKAPKAHPQDAELDAFEDDFTAALAAALTQVGNATLRGINSGNTHLIVNRVNDPATWSEVRKLIARWLTESAEFGATIGREYIENMIFGMKNAALDVSMWDLINEYVLAWALQSADNLTRDLQMVTTPRIQKLVAQYVAERQTIGDLMRNIRDGYHYSEDRAYTIARTEITRAFSEGNVIAWRESGLVKAKKWQTKRDELVCKICGPLHNSIVLLDSQFEATLEDGATYTAQFPPAHPRCRCWLVPSEL